MKNHVKGFTEFVNESDSPDEMESMRYLKDLGMLPPEQEIEVIARELSQKFGVELFQTYSSFEDSNPDEDFGNFINWSPEGTRVSDDQDPVIQIFENGGVQFWFDATPWPTRHNSRDEARHMMSYLNPIPVAWEKLDLTDWEAFIAELRSEYGYDDEGSDEA